MGDSERPDEAIVGWLAQNGVNEWVPRPNQFEITADGLLRFEAYEWTDPDGPKLGAAGGANIAISEDWPGPRAKTTRRSVPLVALPSAQVVKEILAAESELRIADRVA